MKAGENVKVSNYRPISVLSWCSINKRKDYVQHSRQHLQSDKLLYEKQHQTSLLTNCMNLLTKINLQIFVDLSKAFDTANHKNSIRKTQSLRSYYVVFPKDLYWDYFYF